MKKLIYILLLLPFLSFGQFTISETSTDWKKLGNTSTAIISINGDLAKIQFKDIRHNITSADALSPFKSQYQKNVDKIETAILRGNEGIKSGFYEFVFKTEDDTLDKIYNIIIDHLENRKKEMVTLTFPEGNLYLKFDAYAGIMAVSFGIDSDGNKIFCNPIMKSYVNKVFGKKNKQ